jgi:predicted phosphodiesterase
MVRCLAIGDSHIPRRAQAVHKTIITKLNDLTSIDLFDYTFFTGDLIEAIDFIDFLHLKTKKTLFMVIGNMDYYSETNKTAPLYQNLDIFFPTIKN